MTKKDLIEAVAERIGDEKAATHAVNTVLAAIQGAVARGEKVSLTGFGAFEAVHKPARVGRNPQTGEPLEIAESWGPKFRPGQGFKDLVNVIGSGRTAVSA